MSIGKDWVFKVEPPEYLCVAKEAYFGTEFEVECVASFGKLFSFPFTTVTEHAQWNSEAKLGVLKDNSLRNNGFEFITRPLTYQDSLSTFELLYSNVSFNTELSFGNPVKPIHPHSPRTSTHVHVNMCSFTEEQIKVLLLAYALVEPTLFNYVSPVRKHNIHCVPLNQTLAPDNYSKPLTHLVKSWSKYTALNLLPLTTYGTVEFRHLQGTASMGVYRGWLTLLNNLYLFAESTSLNTFTKMLQLLSFEQLHTTILQIPPPLSQEHYHSSILDVKLGLI